jgi:hypothetical protein
MAEQYQEMIESGFCSNQADVARDFGVRRTWVMRVTNTMKDSGNILNLSGWLDHILTIE